jgi:glycerol kinase
MTGKVTTVTTSSSTANILLAGAAADPSAPVSGDLWNNAGTLKFYNGSATKTLAFTDSNITGNAANVTGTVAVGNGGTGVTSFTSNGVIYGNGSSALNVTAAGTWDGTNSVGQILSVNASGVPTWTNTVDGGGY